MVREDLNPVEEARACAALTEELGLSREEVGTRVGRSRVAVSNLIRLLDLPDEALAAIERRELSEGHGRALLLATDHGDRRRLARDAIDGGWSVRTLEDRARRANTAAGRRPRARPRRTALHPDQEAAIQRIGDGFGAALGRDVEVTADAGRRLPRPPQLRIRRRGARARPAPARLTAAARRARAAGAGAARSRRRAVAPQPRCAVRIAAAGRLAQSVRALL